MKPVSPQLLQKMRETLQTTDNNANPKGSVIVSRAKDTVRDANYWTVETIREMSGLGDVSVAPRRLKSYGRPNRLYGIHVHNGEVKTLIREYPDQLKKGWTTQFSLGSGSSVGLAFNGYWERYRKIWRLITEEKPYISWVDSNNDLWVQRWDESEERFQLSSNVTKVRMIRAWKNTAIHYLDQGVVVAYIKTDGTVWYRNYCIQENYEYAWEFEKQLTDFTGVAVNLNLFITNDYRMGFIIQDSLDQIHWLVTHRNWGGMASPAESLITGISDISFSVTPISFHEWKDDEKIDTSIQDIEFYVCPADTNPIILDVERLNFIDKKTIQLTFNYNLECDLVILKSAITLTNTSSQPFTIAEITENNNILTITTVEEMPFSQNITLNYILTEPYVLAFRISDTCLYDYGSNITLVIDGIPPEGFGEENLTFSITDIIFDVKRAYYTNMYEEENIETSITDISFVVTQVGSNPL